MRHQQTEEAKSKLKNACPLKTMSFLQATVLLGCVGELTRQSQVSLLQRQGCGVKTLSKKTIQKCEFRWVETVIFFHTVNFNLVSVLQIYS